jgi:hypothetical protein
MNGLIIALYMFLQAFSANCYADTSAIHPDICTGIGSEIAADEAVLESVYGFGEWVDQITYPLLVELGVTEGNAFTETPNMAWVWSRVIQRGYFRLTERLLWLEQYLAYEFVSYPA